MIQHDTPAEPRAKKDTVVLNLFSGENQEVWTLHCNKKGLVIEHSVDVLYWGLRWFFVCILVPRSFADSCVASLTSKRFPDRQRLELDRLLRKKNFLVGLYTMPTAQGVALAEAIEKLGGKAVVMKDQLKEEGSITGEIEEKEKPSEEEFIPGEQDNKRPGVEQHGEHLLEEVFGEEPQQQGKDEKDVFTALYEKPGEEIREVTIKELDLQNARWKHKIADLKEMNVINLTVALPLKSRHAHEVLQTVSSIFVRLRGLGLPVYRLHSNRAPEFTGKMMREWLLAHDIEHTTTAADESAGNGRAESEIAHLKHHTKLLLNTSNTPRQYWPLALRHASEYRRSPSSGIDQRMVFLHLCRRSKCGDLRLG